MADVTIKTFTVDNFDTEVLKADKPVLVDFWAIWCGPCKMMSPVVDEIAEKYADRIIVGKVNIDENPALAGQFKISSIPTLLLFREGKPVAQSLGYRPAEYIEEMLKFGGVQLN